MKLKEIREIQTSELVARVQELKKELFTLRFKQAAGQSEDASKKKTIRKEIARILTIIKERELANR